MTLAEAQDLFRAAVAGAEPPPPEQLEACFTGSKDLPAAERLAIYAGMYRARLADALRETFPLVARHLGEERFAALAGDYLARHPSEHHDIGQVGRLLPDFLCRFPAPERPDLADLAALEWARQEVFFAPDAAAVGPAAFAGLDAEGFARARLRLSPALRLLDLAHPVAEAWRRLEAGEEAGLPDAGPVALAAWRSGFDVFHAELPGDEAAALRSAAAGRPLAEVCAAFAGRDDPAAAAHTALSGWLADGWIAAVEG